MQKKNKESWFDRFNWEQIYAYRTQIGTALLIVLVIVWAFNWYISRSESTSLTNSLRAEKIFERLHHPSQEEEPAPSIDEFIKLSPSGSANAQRFSGIIVEEKMIAHEPDFSSEYYQMAIKRIEKSDLPIHAQAVQALVMNGDQAVSAWDSIIEQSEQFPALRCYALLQRVRLSSVEQKKEYITRMEKCIEEHAELADLLEEWTLGNKEKFVKYISL